MADVITALRRAARAVGVFFEFVEPEPVRLDCSCPAADSVIIRCPACDHATCENHRTDHTCRETTDAR